MKCLETIVTVLAAIALIGSIGASLQQQASAIIVDWKEKFTTLTDDFKKAVLGSPEEKTGDPPSERIQSLLIEYDNNVKELLGIKPSGEATPPEPDAQSSETK